MESLLAILLLISFGAMVVGLIRPSAVRVPTRGKALRNYGLATLALFILFAVIADPVETDATGSTDQGSHAATVLATPDVEDNGVKSAPVRSSTSTSMPTATPGAAPGTATDPQPSSPTSRNLTPAQRNALRSANSYLKMSGFSRQGLIDQLSSEYGEQFSVGDATVAVDNLDIDWNAQAARSAAAYLKMSGFSCQGLIDQLSSPHGEKYTVSQATYGAKQAGIC